ncbi:hypothetical protein FGO68_gene15438 [Halteria grandinella]|uniref:Uncharacterized protein n=1 Tax=Halteria grandinella TaxID=5974 RepID=A0A8J8NV14_HALGN|nr:hypothetical protein FGO68_gene15438 [Halteria grandinella]
MGTNQSIHTTRYRETLNNFKLGKISSKFIQLEILSYSFYQDAGSSYLHCATYFSRTYLIKNIKLLRAILIPNHSLGQKMISIEQPQIFLRFAKNHPIQSVPIKLKDYTFEYLRVLQDLLGEERVKQFKFRKWTLPFKKLKYNSEIKYHIQFEEIQCESLQQVAELRVMLRKESSLKHLIFKDNDYWEKGGHSIRILGFRYLAVPHLTIVNSNSSNGSMAKVGYILKFLRPRQNGVLTIKIRDKINLQGFFELAEAITKNRIAPLTRLELEMRECPAEVLNAFANTKLALNQIIKPQIVNPLIFNTFTLSSLGLEFIKVKIIKERFIDSDDEKDKQYRPPVQLIDLRLKLPNGEIGEVQKADRELLRQQMKQYMNLENCYADLWLTRFIMNYRDYLKLGLSKFKIDVDDDFKLNEKQLKSIGKDLAIQETQMVSSISIQANKDQDNKSFFQAISYIVRKFPYLQELSLNEKDIPNDELIVDSSLSLDQWEPQCLRTLSILIQNKTNLANFYLDLLAKASQTIRSLTIENNSGYEKVNGILLKQAVPTLHAINTFSILTELTFKTKKLFLSNEDIKLFHNFSNLRSLTMKCYFDQDSMQHFLETHLTQTLSNLKSLYLEIRLPDIVKALSGPHKCLMSLTCKQAIPDKYYVQQISLEQAMAIVEGKNYGFQFKAPFERPRELIKRCQTAIIINHVKSIHSVKPPK